MLIVTEAIGLLSEALLSSSGSIFHKCAHTEQLFLDLWSSSGPNLLSKIDGALQLLDQLVLWTKCAFVSFPRLPSAFIAFVCDDDEFRCTASQLLRHLGSGGKIDSSNKLVAKMLVAMAPHCAPKIAAWSLEFGHSESVGHSFFRDSPALLQDALASIHSATAAIAALDGDALFRRRLYSQIMSCSSEAFGVAARVRGAFAAVPDKKDLGACCHALFLSLVKSLKTDSNINDPSPTTISFACALLASYHVLCESRFQKHELLSSIFQGFPCAAASSAEIVEATSEVVKLFRSLSQSKMHCELGYESSHPLSCSTHQFDIVFPLARQVSITFDARTCADIDWVLKICHGRQSTSCCEGEGDDDDRCSARYWPGVGDAPPLIIAGPSFTVKMLESHSDESWGFKFTATASYDHPLSEIQSLISDAAVKYALQTTFIEERVAFVYSEDAALHGQMLRDLYFISDIASGADGINTLRLFFEEQPAVFAHIFKWVMYFSLHSADHTAALACYESFVCFLTMAGELITSLHQPSHNLVVAPTPPSSAFTSQCCVDVFTEREFSFEMCEVNQAGESVSQLNVSSAKNKAASMLSSKSRGWCSNGRLGKVCFKSVPFICICFSSFLSPHCIQFFAQL